MPSITQVVKDNTNYLKQIGRRLLQNTDVIRWPPAFNPSMWDLHSLTLSESKKWVSRSTCLSFC